MNINQRDSNQNVTHKMFPILAPGMNALHVILSQTSPIAISKYKNRVFLKQFSLL